jgi:hypothetical protein
MTDTMRSVLIQGARRYLEGTISQDEYIQGFILALAESPNNEQKQHDIEWLAILLDGDISE